MSLTILNRTSAPAILRFYDVCFKSGVIDAYEYGDDLAVKEFLDKKTEDWTFGTLGKYADMDWQAFRYTLYWWSRKKRMTSFAEKYIFKLTTKNYTWCFLVYCMRFYLLGIQEWLSYPSPVGLEIFKATPKIHWDKNSEIKKFTKGDYFSHMHDIAYDFSRIDEESRPISSNMMDGFCEALFDLTRGY